MTTQLDTTLLDAKHPFEDPVLEFDFEGELGPVSGTPVITVTPINGTDPDALDMLDGAFQISGTSVFQRVSNGLNNINYELLCKASDGTNNRVRRAILPVREK